MLHLSCIFCNASKMSEISSLLQYTTKSTLAFYQIDHDSYRSVSSKESEQRVLYKKKSCSLPIG